MGSGFASRNEGFFLHKHVTSAAPTVTKVADDACSTRSAS